MAQVTIEPDGEVAVLRLANGTTNAVNPELVASFSSAIQKVRSDFRGVVLAGGEKFFCIGLSVPELISLNREEMRDFWYDFNQVTLDLYTLPLPSACAIAGHAPAVGTIWACACDFRFAAEGKISLGLNEIQLGIPTPFLADLMLRQIIGDQPANHILYHGRLMRPEEAKALGLVNEVCSKQDVEQRATAKIRELSDLSNQAYRAIKEVRNEKVRENFEKNFKARHETFIDAWFSDHAQKRLQAAIKHF